MSWSRKKDSDTRVFMDGRNVRNANAINAVDGVKKKRIFGTHTKSQMSVRPKQI